MKFIKKQVYTALNADKLKSGDKVILADSLGHLKRKVEACRGENDPDIKELWKIGDEDCWGRFKDRDFSYENDEHSFPLAYLVGRAE